jgi:hypothetical protein
MSEDNSQPENISTYAKIEIPDLKSDIPAYLVKDSSEAERYILDQMSILIQHAKWTSNVLSDISENTRKTNGRVIKLEGWRNMFSSWWILAGALMSIVGGVVGVIEIVKFLTKTP